MTLRTSITAAVAAIVLITASGCAVTRGQETVGAYIDDATITTQIKGRFVENTEVANAVEADADAAANSVDNALDAAGTAIENTGEAVANTTLRLPPPKFQIT